MLLKSGHQSADFTPFVEHLKSLPPARVDLEIRSLDPRLYDGYSELSCFVMALTSSLRTKRDFELVNAWMAVFLRAHADMVRKCSEQDVDETRVLRNSLDAWTYEQQLEEERLARLVGYCRGVVGFLRSAR